MFDASFIDISVPVNKWIPIWPDTPLPLIEKRMSFEQGDPCTVSWVGFDAHTGTHIDAPLHFIEDGKTTAEIPLTKLIGDCVVAYFPGITSITADHLAKAKLPKAKKLLLKTDNSLLWNDMRHDFHEDFVALSADGAQWVVDQGIHLVGIDYLSIQRFHDPIDTHVILLSNEVVILETLDLRFVEPSVYNLICLPMRLEGVEGFPVRAVLQVL